MTVSRTPGVRNAIPAHKRVPYLPERVKTGELAGRPRMRENLNGEVTVGTTEVACRHLALSYIEDRQFLDLAAQNRRGLHKYYGDGKLEAVADRMSIWRGSPPEAWQPVGNRQFGRWLADVAGEMERNGKACAEALLLLPTAGTQTTHAMAVRIQHKSREGAGYIRVSCYDPNGNAPGGTGNHTALEVTRPDELHPHAMQDFFTGLCDHFVGNVVDTACVAAICPDLPLPTTRALPYLGRGDPESGLPPEHAAALFAAVMGGLRDPLLTLCRLLASRGVTGSEALPLLHNQQLPLLYAACSWRPGLFESFAEALRLLDVRGIEALPALLSRHRNGFSTLHCAVENGDTTAAFVDFALALARLDVTGNVALAALANRAQGVAPALEVAAMRKAPDTFVNFAKALRVLGITGAQARQAILGLAEDGTMRLVDLVRHHQDRNQIEDLDDALVLLDEPFPAVRWRTRIAADDATAGCLAILDPRPAVHAVQRFSGASSPIVLSRSTSRPS